MSAEIEELKRVGQIYHRVHRDCNNGFMECIFIDRTLLPTEVIVAHLVREATTKEGKRYFVTVKDLNESMARRVLKRLV